MKKLADELVYPFKFVEFLYDMFRFVSGHPR